MATLVSRYEVTDWRGRACKEGSKMSEWSQSDCACKLSGVSRVVSSNWVGTGIREIMGGSSVSEVVDD